MEYHGPSDLDLDSRSIPFSIEASMGLDFRKAFRRQGVASLPATSPPSKSVEPVGREIYAAAYLQDRIEYGLRWLVEERMYRYLME